MSTPTHDPVRFASDLGAKLATRSRHVCALVGAGVSRACGLPDVAGLQKAVIESLDGADRETFKTLLTNRNLEEVLSRLRRIAALLEGKQDIDGLTSEKAAELDRDICAAIVSQLALENADLEPMRKLASWAVGSDYHRPLEIFTVNYDLLLETALEEIGALWFDGFVGSLRAPFRVDLVEDGGENALRIPPDFMRLWKLHGSLNWAWHGAPGSIVRLGGPASEEEAAAIYPADTKYEESRRVPFVVLMDRFRRAVNEPETLLLVSGYSFSDQHLDEMIFDAAIRRPRSEFVVFCYSDIPAALAKKAERTPALTVVSKSEAILATVRGKWAGEEDVEGIWEGGEFQFSNFSGLAAYLASKSGASSPEDE